MATLLINHPFHQTLHVDGVLIGRIQWNDSVDAWEFTHDKSNFTIHDSTLDRIHAKVRAWVDGGMIIPE